MRLPLGEKEQQFQTAADRFGREPEPRPLLAGCVRLRAPLKLSQLHIMASLPAVAES
ncbi:MAG: hypothetical protein LBP22_05900 [Deltaproteobacteria bacterium]|nr:hypothetical protein [Deltaproteobacteria bacterium]